jgi:hypothetical protein
LKKNLSEEDRELFDELCKTMDLGYVSNDEPIGPTLKKAIEKFEKVSKRPDMDRIERALGRLEDDLELYRAKRALDELREEFGRLES